MPVAAAGADGGFLELPHYRPERNVKGVIRNWGNNEMASLIARWEAAFRRYQPGIRFEDKLHGPASAMAGVYTGVADLSWAGHELWKEESMAFQWVFQYPVFPVQLATSSLNVHDSGATLAIFVHKDNPITRLTLAQLDAVFGSEHKHGGSNARNWGDLELTGEWADKPIHPYGYDAETEAAFFFRQTALKGSFKWSCDFKEFNNEQRADGRIVDAGPRILDALAKDRYGIAYAKLRYLIASVKAIALAGSGSGPYLMPDKESVQQRKYPLSRVMTVYMNRVPKKPIEPAVTEFLRYVLSQEGQRAVETDGGYLPLTAAVAREQLRSLE